VNACDALKCRRHYLYYYNKYWSNFSLRSMNATNRFASRRANNSAVSFLFKNCNNELFVNRKVSTNARDDPHLNAGLDTPSDGPMAYQLDRGVNSMRPPPPPRVLTACLSAAQQACRLLPRSGYPVHLSVRQSSRSNGGNLLPNFSVFRCRQRRLS
jgi:hypothetical protein